MALNIGYWTCKNVTCVSFFRCHEFLESLVWLAKYIRKGFLPYDSIKMITLQKTRFISTIVAICLQTYLHIFDYSQIFYCIPLHEIKLSTFFIKISFICVLTSFMVKLIEKNFIRPFIKKETLCPGKCSVKCHFPMILVRSIIW